MIVVITIIAIPCRRREGEGRKRGGEMEERNREREANKRSKAETRRNGEQDDSEERHKT
jgi:hypothetical protein